MHELICILCPRGCHLKVDEQNNYHVTGNFCPKGITYGKEEVLNPVRVVTSTVKTDSTLYPRCPVKTDRPIPKDKVFDAMDLLDNLEVKTPIHSGQIIVANLFGEGANFVATRTIGKPKESEV